MSRDFRVLIALFAAVPMLAASSKLALIGSQHDLSATGAGPVKSNSTEACIFCHAPHNINPNVTPLWDHALSAQSYVTYTSSTYTSGAQTPAAGSSKLCLSCHDGTVAVGLTVTQGQIATTGSMASSDVLGTNLSTSHPVSMTPADDGSLVSTLFPSPGTTKDSAVKLVGGKVECTTCHDPHAPRNDPAVPMFLVRSNSGGALCLACHDPTRSQPNFLNGWTTSSHATSGDAVPVTAGFGPYGTVAADACSNCHLGHNNAVGPRNQRALEEAACTRCHGGANVTPALLNVAAEFSAPKTYVHPTMTVSGVHDPAESLPVNNTRHAECADCHNSHTASAQVGTALPPAIQASMTGTTGWVPGSRQSPANTEYQICYKCHADSSNKPLTSTFGRTAVRYPQGNLPTGPNIAAPPDQYNLALKFNSSISHKVAGSSIMTTTVGSLFGNMLDVNKAPMANRPLTRTSYIYCTDCHDNNQARSNNGTGPNGPHGSTFSHLLAFNLYQDTGSRGTGTTMYDLCGRCHNITTLRADNGVHAQHIGSDVGAGCTVCHDPHGVIGGSTVSNFAMVNLDTAIATPFGGTYYGVTYSGGRVTCYLRCHGETHNPQSYRYP
jgi:predicted CXXCH cytochrome family protein